MKKLFLLLPILFLLVAVSAGAHDKPEGPDSCKQCGMSRIAYAHSRMLIIFADGSRIGVCSLNCAANELQEHRGKKVKSLQVADYDSKKLIDAKKAFWVIGGNKQGVMTATPKWAFAEKADADSFIATNGGKLASFEEALALAEE